MTGDLANNRVLLVEDTLSLARTYVEYLRDEPYEIMHVETGAEANKALAEWNPVAVLLDLVLPDMDGLDILREISKGDNPPAVVVITAHGSVNTAVEAMRLGAFDFVVKPFNAKRLSVTLNNALEHLRLTKIVEIYKNDFDRDSYCGFIGASLPMQAVYRIIDSAASSKATVFITGDSGTGKEVCAEAIHRQSPRADKPFIAINCGAIPKDLMESEIFGHAKGAFTGAVAEREGAAKQADGGTLFLDEICEMDINLQTKLLRFIQTGSFQKVGGSSLETVDIRVVCATNKDPFEEVAKGNFREDLFYRLHVVPVHLPPLKERDDDVLLIARAMLQGVAAEEGKDFASFDPEAEVIIRTYDWPGNVRQLQNVIRNTVVLNNGDAVSRDMLPPPLDRVSADASSLPPPVLGAGNQAGASRQGTTYAAFGSDSGDLDAMIKPLADVERDVIERAISLCGDNIPKAAAYLGISASTIYRKKTAWDSSGDAA